MLPSEKLMLLLELNGVDVSNYLLRRQVEIKDGSQKGAHKIQTVKKLLEFIYDENADEKSLKNPLAYQSKNKSDINYLEEITVNHPDFNQEMTLAEFLKLDKFNTIQKESILYDIFDEYVRDYRDSTNALMDNYEQMALQYPKKHKRYKRPSFLKFIIALFISIYLLLIFHKPEYAFIFGNSVQKLMIDNPWYNFLIFMTTFVFILYAVLNNIFVRFIKDIRSEKIKKINLYFKKWRTKLDKKRLKQSGILEDYVDDVLHEEREEPLPLMVLSGPEKLLLKYRRYVIKLHFRYDFFRTYHPLFTRILKYIFRIAILLLAISILLMIGINGGWLNG